MVCKCALYQITIESNLLLIFAAFIVCDVANSFHRIHLNLLLIRCNACHRCGNTNFAYLIPQMGMLTAAIPISVLVCDSNEMIQMLFKEFGLTVHAILILRSVLLTKLLT